MLNIVEIGGSAFDHCLNLKFIDIPDTVKVMTEGSIRCSKELKVVRLPEHFLIQEYDDMNERPITTHRKPVDEDNVFSIYDIYFGEKYPVTIVGDRVCKERG